MKKRLFFMSNQKGFFLPYVLFVSALVLIIVTANINTYNQDIFMTQNHLDQINMETLVQMGRIKFKDEIEIHQKDKGEVEYVFPEGRVALQYTRLTELEYNLLFTIRTRKDSEYIIRNYVNISDKENLKDD